MDIDTESPELYILFRLRIFFKCKVMFFRVDAHFELTSSPEKYVMIIWSYVLVISLLPCTLLFHVLCFKHVWFSWTPHKVFTFEIVETLFKFWNEHRKSFGIFFHRWIKMKAPPRPPTVFYWVSWFIFSSPVLAKTRKRFWCVYKSTFTVKNFHLSFPDGMETCFVHSRVTGVQACCSMEL